MNLNCNILRIGNRKMRPDIQTALLNHQPGVELYTLISDPKEYQRMQYLEGNIKQLHNKLSSQNLTINALNQEIIQLKGDLEFARKNLKAELTAHREADSRNYALFMQKHREMYNVAST